jgi:hypothetical protein
MATMSDRDYRERYGDKLGDSAARAKWISSPDEHEGHQGETLAARDHEVIMQWAADRGGKPATVPGTEHDGRPGVLRFDFPGGSKGRLQEVAWDRWFETFDERDLVMLFQERLSNGSRSNFFRLISPHREDA